MTYCFELNMATIVFWTFIIGMLLGFALCKILIAPSKPIKPIGYDGTNGKGCQPRPPPPKPLHNKCK